MLSIDISSGKAIYLQIKDRLQEKIIDGELAAESKLPSDVEMCALFGVSRNTLRAAYAELVKEGLLIRKPGPTGGTFVTADIHPSTSKSFANSRDVGALVLYSTDIANGYIHRMLLGADEVFRAMEYSLHVFTQRGHSILTPKGLLSESINQRTLGGLLLLHHWDAKDIRQLQQIGCPVVSLDVGYTGLDMPTVSVDDAEAAYQATKDLVLQGHKKIALTVIKKQSTFPYVVNRAATMPEGYMAALKDMGVDYSKIIVKSISLIDDSIDDIRDELDRTLDEVTAIIFDGDFMARKVYMRMQQRGQIVGKDIVLVNYKDTLDLPGVRTIFKPLYEMGKVAAGMLIRQIHNLPFERKRVLSTTGTQDSQQLEMSVI